MSNEKTVGKGKSNFIAFVLGIIVGKKGLKLGAHILYVSIILLTFLFAQNGPLNTFVTNLSTDQCGEEARENCKVKLSKATDKTNEEIKILKRKIKRLRKHENVLVSECQMKKDNVLSNVKKDTLYFHRNYDEGTTYLARVISVNNNTVLYNTYEGIEDSDNNDIAMKLESKGLIRPLYIFKARYYTDELIPTMDKKLTDSLNLLDEKG